MIEKTESEQSQTLSRIERLQLSCALLGPGLVLALVWQLIDGYLPAWETLDPSLSKTFSSVSFFVFSTWVVRWAIGWQFPGFRLHLVRFNVLESERTVRYGESLRIAWLIAWRSTAILYVPICVGVLAWEMVRAKDASTHQLPHIPDAVVWFLYAVIEFLIYVYGIVQPLIDKQFTDFSLKVERQAGGPGR